jgi:hypothetical protein
MEGFWKNLHVFMVKIVLDQFDLSPSKASRLSAHCELALEGEFVQLARECQASSP